eukprot:COSAG03_NODE_5873_length_1157_cov_2.676749_2_plen_134_part_00
MLRVAQIWNEITFGSDFLAIDNYYSPPLYPDYMQHHGDNGCGSRLDPHNQTIGNNCDHMIQAVVDTANAHPEVFSGAKIINGFANEPPCVSSTLTVPFALILAYSSRTLVSGGSDVPRPIFASTGLGIIPTRR